MLPLKTKCCSPSSLVPHDLRFSQFEMAVEETEKKTMYAAEDRDAAKEAVKQLKEAYEKSLKQSSPQVAQEIRARVSQRIRELDNANTALEESAIEH